MTLDEARQELECRFTIFPDIGNYALAATGEPYVEVVSGGATCEGDRLPCICSSPDIAIRMWLVAALEYTKSRYGTLYWRKVPELNSVTFLSEDYQELSSDLRECWGKHTFWFVYSRFLISEQPRTGPAVIDHLHRPSVQEIGYAPIRAVPK
jgi:hypothetical protein